ncbi:Nicotinate-nucleotide adenylyltransferase [Paenibacillus konkukensis]|uniref:Probable nicotinate-nucleotide adenylyltransferase n=1 Tax=Paenibacillus konkukensis TaxID=2020716 RepID=A0ABY4S0C4_9BACL|nr:nicotinate-nucleotide adenylyltransferase [Paenibacillus konkukensis]UQZ86939.1 Nicotinate-nucleotide adenylyltransferase [Paenibacillus konkukensis]
MKVGIMGGTFDPIHTGHLIAAQSACEQAKLDEVWFMPTNVPPHKSEAPGASARQRWEMVALAVEGNPRFKPVDLELKKGGVSYSIDTVKLLTQTYPGIHFYYIIGADMVQYLPKWYKIGELVQLVSFIGLQRPGYEVEISSLPAAVREALIMAQMPLMELSSTNIRERLSRGLPVRYRVPDSVNDYIEVNGIYGS